MSISYHHTACFISLLALGCASAPTTVPMPRSGIEVAAPLAKTWDAVIDVFSAKNIPIKTMDRSSGFIVTEEMYVPFKPRESPYADCGRAMGAPTPPTHANYNIRLKGDSTRSNVQVTVFWKELNPAAQLTKQCVSNGVWESAAESEIKARAETR